MLVVDSSFLIAILFEEEHTAFAIEQLGGALSFGLAAPSLLHWEVANVLRNKVLRQQVSFKDAAARLDGLARLSIGFPDREATPAILLDLALAWGLTAYDAAYVELAVRTSASLATLDRDMARSARAAGVVVQSPFV